MKIYIFIALFWFMLKHLERNGNFLDLSIDIQCGRDITDGNYLSL